MAGVLSYAMTLNTGGFTGPMNRASSATNSMSSSSGGLLSSFSRMVGPMAAAAGGVLSLTAAIGGVKKAFNAAADFEATATSFATLMGSTAKANKLLQELEETSSSTPYTFNELANAGRKLLSVSDEGGLVSDLRMIGDIASASERDIGELSSMYAKILGGDMVQGEDIAQIADLIGKDGMEEFQKIVGVDTPAALRKMGSDGQISGAQLTQLFRKLTSEGGKYFEAMEAQSKTTRGLLSTLKENFDKIFRTIGQPIKDMIKPMLQDAIVWSKAFAQSLKFAIDVGRNVIANGDLGEILFRKFQIGIIDITRSFVGMFEGLGQIAGNFASIIVDSFSGVDWSDMTTWGNIKAPDIIKLDDDVDFSGAGGEDMYGLERAAKLAKNQLQNLFDKNAPAANGISDEFEKIREDAEATSVAIQDAAKIANGAAGGGGGGKEDEGGKIKLYNQEESLKRRYDRMSKADKESGGFTDFYSYLGHYGNIGDQSGGIGGADRGALDAFMREQGGGDVIGQHDRLLGFADQLDGGPNARPPRAGGGGAAGGGTNMLQQIRDGIFAIRDNLEDVATA